jgi:alkylation response protein AidB-like acyl-CoA dehydrogenase
MRRRQDTELEARIRAEVRPWMDEHAGWFGPRVKRERPLDTPEFVARCRDWQRELDEGGWGVVAWPERFGGRGYGPVETRVVRDEEARFAVPTGPFAIAIGMVANVDGARHR